MEHDIEVLESLVSGIDMGINASDEVMKNVEDEKLKMILIEQARSYKALKAEAEEQLEYYQRDKENKHVFETAMLKSMVKMKTMMNNDDHKIAKMLIEGSTQAIMSMQTLINDYPDIEEKPKALCEQFLNLSKEHINQWKDFL
ncbi:DUF2383 domain-containing protein [Beduini massiliensis]|uniref:DUF2383 domain-containing protein n=1 Tax=Beduini massiliensis TaxID=1585974 RepID=UPI00059AA9BF|nr:DUF2383 domain-containing protein [Beduini massiliensis]